VIVTAIRYRRVPAFYVRHVMRQVERVVAANPGFHRFLIDLPVLGRAETGRLINPDVEPEVRRLLAKVMVLAAPAEDDDPWGVT
jgi:hypothetical protein